MECVLDTSESWVRIPVKGLTWVADVTQICWQCLGNGLVAFPECLIRLLEKPTFWGRGWADHPVCSLPNEQQQTAAKWKLSPTLFVKFSHCRGLVRSLEEFGDQKADYELIPAELLLLFSTSPPKLISLFHQGWNTERSLGWGEKEGSAFPLHPKLLG